MDREQLLAQWKEEEGRGMTGWDFSHMVGRYTVEPLPWDYSQVVKEFLRPGVRLLDMGTGGGEFLLTLGHPYALTSVTEGWAPNLALCKKRLEPLGVTVREYDSEKGQPMPFPDDSFDLVINRHESYDLSEAFSSPSRWGAKTTCPWCAGCAPASLGDLWALTWKTSCPGSARRVSG